MAPLILFASHSLAGCRIASRRAASPSRPLDALLTFEAQWPLVL